MTPEEIKKNVQDSHAEAQAAKAKKEADADAMQLAEAYILERDLCYTEVHDDTSNIFEGKKLKFYKEDFYQYDNGYYKKLTEKGMKNDVTLFLAETEMKGAHKKAGCNAINNVIQCLAALCEIKGKQEPFWELYDGTTEDGEQWINLKNGLLSLENLIAEKKRPEQLFPHSPRFFSLSQIPVEYDYNKIDIPLWQVHLDRALPDKESQGELKRSFGYSMTTDNSYHISFFLQGQPRSGKSTIASVLVYLVGRENKAEVQWNQFDENGFYLEHLMYKKIDMSAEIQEEDKTNEGTIKRIASGNPITINCKGRKQIPDVYLYCKLWWDTNHFPYIFDKSGAMEERITIFRFREESFIPAEKRIREYDKIIWNSESSALLNWALDGLIETYKEKYWIKSKQSKEALAEFKEDHISIADMFVEDYMEKQVGSFESRKSIRDCLETSGKKTSPNKVFEAMRLAGYKDKQHKFGTEKNTRGFHDCILKSHKAGKGSQEESKKPWDKSE